jgi:hypothetical protein
MKNTDQNGIYNCVDWAGISDHNNMNYLFIFDPNTKCINQKEISKINRDELLRAENYVEYSIHKLNHKGSVAIYTFLKRIIDQHNNLIIIASVENNDIERI